MKIPYIIHIEWIDYRCTTDDEMYEVTIYNATQNQVVDSWQTTASNLARSIAKYMETDI